MDDAQLRKAEEDTGRVYDSKTPQLPPDRGSVDQADYKKFVYSPREQHPLYQDHIGKNEQTRPEKLSPGLAQTQGVADGGEAGPMPSDLVSRPDDAFAQNRMDPAAVQFSETDRRSLQSDDLSVVVTGSAKVGKSSLIRHLCKGQQAEGSELVLLSGD